MEVVGVTTTGKYRLLFEDPQPYFYVPIAQNYTALRVLHVRSSLAPERLARDVERAIHGLEPDLPLYDVQSMTKALDSARGRFLVRGAALFAGVLALLAVCTYRSGAVRNNVVPDKRTYARNRRSNCAWCHGSQHRAARCR